MAAKSPGVPTPDTFSNSAPTSAGPSEAIGGSINGDIVFGNKSGFDYKTIFLAGVGIFLFCIISKKHKGN